MNELVRYLASMSATISGNDCRNMLENDYGNKNDKCSPMVAICEVSKVHGLFIENQLSKSP